MLRGGGFGYRGLRWGAVGLSAVVAVAAFADAASARRSHRPKQSAGESYQPSYASIVVDANSGAVMQATNADSPRHPAVADQDYDPLFAVRAARARQGQAHHRPASISARSRASSIEARASSPGNRSASKRRSAPSLQSRRTMWLSSWPKRSVAMRPALPG